MIKLERVLGNGGRYPRLSSSLDLVSSSQMKLQTGFFFLNNAVPMPTQGSIF